MAEPVHYRIDLPSRPQSVALARMFIATVLRLHGASPATVDDAKLAVSELVTVAIRDSSGDEEIVVVATVAPENVAVAVSPVRGVPTGEPVEGLDIAAALFPSTTVGDGGEAAFSIDLALT